MTSLLDVKRLVNNFFFVPRKFFSERPALWLPFRRRRSGNLFRFTQLVNSFLTRPDFSNPAANPSATLRQLEASFYPAPSRAVCQQLIFREQKNNRLVAQQSPVETRTLATGTSVPQRRRRFMHLYSPPVNSFFAIFFQYPENDPSRLECLFYNTRTF